MNSFMSAPWILRLAFVWGTACLWLTVEAKSPELPPTLDASAIDAYLTSLVRQEGKAGLSVTLVKEGRVVLSKGYGKRSLESGAPVETDTLFGIGSVSKQFTCAAVLLLAEEGRLSVQDKIAKYYPSLTRAQDISLLDLMNHVSGYPDFYPLDFLDRRMLQPITPDELLKIYAGGKLDFEPGSKWSYSNTGFILLARVVERVSGKPFGQFLQERIFTPLKMTHTVYEADPKDSRLAIGYMRFALGKTERAPLEASGWLGGAGAIASTPSDLMLWDLALMEGRVLKPESWALFTQARLLPNGKSTQYGCGVGVRIQSSRQTVTHGGSVGGFNAWNGMVPSTRSVVALTCNFEGGLGDLPTKLFDLILKEPSNAPKVQAPAAEEISKTLFTAIRKGRVNRAQFSEEFNLFLTDARIKAAAKRFQRYGEPTGSELLSKGERGGLEVTHVRLKFKTGTLTTLMYRRPDGIVEQFFVDTD